MIAAARTEVGVEPRLCAIDLEKEVPVPPDAVSRQGVMEGLLRIGIVPERDAVPRAPAYHSERKSPADAEEPIASVAGVFDVDRRSQIVAARRYGDGNARRCSPGGLVSSERRREAQEHTTAPPPRAVEDCSTPSARAGSKPPPSGSSTVISWATAVLAISNTRRLVDVELPRLISPSGVPRFSQSRAEASMDAPTVCNAVNCGPTT